MDRSCGKLPIYNPAVYKHRFFAHVEIHLVSSNVQAVKNLVKNFSYQKLWWESSVCRANSSWFVMFVFHVWVTKENGVCWTSLCFYPFCCYLYTWEKLAREVPQSGWLWLIGSYIDWLMICWIKRIVWQLRRRLGLFCYKKICNLEPSVISATLKRSRNDSELKIEKPKRITN